MDQFRFSFCSKQVYLGILIHSNKDYTKKNFTVLHSNYFKIKKIQNYFEILVYKSQSLNVNFFHVLGGGNKVRNVEREYLEGNS